MRERQDTKGLCVYVCAGGGWRKQAGGVSVLPKIFGTSNISAGQLGKDGKYTNEVQDVFYFHNTDAQMLKLR